jgi:NADH-quinone oxidoreductase subunit N
MFETPTLNTLAEYNLNYALPAIWLASSTMILLLFDLFISRERKHWTPILALSFITVSFVMTLFNFNPSLESETVLAGMFAADAFTGLLNIVALGTAFLTILLSTDYLKQIGTNHGEYYVLLLLSTAGVMFMVAANDLIVIFIALELLSIPLYILAAFRATNPDYISKQSGLLEVEQPEGDRHILLSEESGMKYFILGAFSSAFLVYGFALLYGATGTTNLPEIFAVATELLSAEGTEGATVPLLLLMGSALSLVGLGFKIAAVPFHMWTPDVYEGSPTPVTAFMSIAAKVGGFGALLRLMMIGLSGVVLEGADVAAWQTTVQIIAAITLIVGNVIAISQTNVKRLLAYSSIAHAGYILMAVAAVGTQGLNEIAAQAVAIYLLAYMFTNIGAFAVVQTIEKADGGGVDLDDFNGFYNRSPWLAVAMAVFMFSLTGIPLTGGFLGKWLVFGAAVQADLIVLAVIGVLTSVISAFYYMRVVVNMYLRDGEGPELLGATQPVRMTVYASMAGVLITGIFVPLVINLASAITF